MAGRPAGPELGEMLPEANGTSRPQEVQTQPGDDVYRSGLTVMDLAAMPPFEVPGAITAGTNNQLTSISTLGGDVKFDPGGAD